MPIQFKFSYSRIVLVVIGSAIMSVWSCGRNQEIAPPVAKVIPKVDTLFGEVLVDNYYWLREKDNPEVIKYIKAENEYTEAVMRHTKGFQDELYKEMLARIKETDMDVPEMIEDYYYYTRSEMGKQYRIYCRKKGGMEAEEEILLDLNELAKGCDYLELGVYKVSPDHKFLAFSIDTTGSEQFILHIKDLTSGKLLKDRIANTYYSAEWANDSKTLFYNVLDEIKRPYRIYRHRLGDDPSADVLVYQEDDRAYELNISKTKSKKYILINLESLTTTEVRFLSADDPTGLFKLIHPRQRDMEYYVYHHDQKFYIRTNDKAKNFKLMEVSVRNPGKSHWREVIGHRDSVMIDEVDVFKNHLVVYERENGLKKIRVTDLESGEINYVNFPEPVYTFQRAGNKNFDANILRFIYSSLITPKSVYDYNMDDKTSHLKKQYEVLGGYDKSRYVTERIFAKASDGTVIPISVVYKKGFVRDGNNPVFLYGYGSYGSCTEPNFSSNRISLLDRGFIFAIAHVRGGGEMGRFWYDDGKLLNKMHTFTDFIACAEHLIDNKYTSRDKLVIHGGSAGGLLIGAVVNMRPELFKVAIAEVPFVDIINTMLDPSIPLTVNEYEEWGNPQKRKYFDYIRAYSPYDNVEAKDYPNMLVTAGLNDPRVQYWEPTKWTAKLRANKTDENTLLLKTNMGYGHFGASGRYDELRELAFEYAFIFGLFGINE